MKLRSVLCGFLVAVALPACGDDAAGDACFDSTFALIQSEIFEKRGCTNELCHGAPAADAQGNLDLREGFAFDALVNVDGIAGDFPLVFPNDEEESLLYLKLRAKIGENDLSSLGILGGPMPATGEPLSADELELVRQWIRGGASENRVVRGTEELIGCGGDVSADPNKIDPPPVPAVTAGVQFYSGGWDLGANDENEVCFVSYYDYSDQIPAEHQQPCDEANGGPSRNCFAYNRVNLSQDPQSHHSIVEKYIPPADKPEQWNPMDESWLGRNQQRDWTCLGGANAGSVCTPGGADCGERSQCTTAAITSVGCTLYGGGPAELGSIGGFFGTEQARQNIATAQEASFRERYPSGVFDMMPVTGFVIWDSHAFNLNDQSTELEQWLTLEFAGQADRNYRRRQIFDANDIFSMGILEPFQTKEICGSYTIPQFGRLLTLTSHTHRYGKDFRVWYPPNDPCNTLAGECDTPTRPFDYQSRTYDDPLYLRFANSGPLEFDSEDAADRTFRFCSLYDNGASNPTEVKRESGKPLGDTCDFISLVQGLIPNGAPITLTQCGCPAEERFCLGGPNQGMACNGDDAACGEGGVCDACAAGPGVTTEDEMFILLGSYFVEAP